MEYEYDSLTISPRNASCQHCNGNVSVHFAMPFPIVNCQLPTVNWIHTFSAKENNRINKPIIHKISKNVNLQGCDP